MNESGASETRQEMASLRQLGAATFDPVRFFYLDVLARRRASQRGAVQRFLDDKLAQTLVTLRGNFEQAQTESQKAVDQAAPDYPQAAAELQRLHLGGDFAAVKQHIAKLKHGVNGTALGELTRQLSQHLSPEGADSMGSTDRAGRTGLRPELQATQYFRKTWAKLSIDKRVTQALGQAPKNAGPINSHMLVLRSLALMRDISPDYLNRLTAYVDTLLCLDQGDRQKPATAKKTTGAAAAKRTKSRPVRGPSR